MSWYEDVAEYIGQNLEAFIIEFFPDTKPVRGSSGIKINPAPCCGHNDCFSFSKRYNSGRCFSCGTKGTRIQIAELFLGQDRARAGLEKWSGIRYVPKEYSEEEKQTYELHKKAQEIAHKAIQFYHERLLNDPKALEKQLGTDQAAGHRGHTLEGLKAFHVGLSGDYVTFYQKMQAEGYAHEAIREAGKLIWVPEGNFVYPYYDIKGNIVRVNTKLWFRTCQTKKNAEGEETGCGFVTFDLSKAAKEAHEKETGHTMAADGHSTGDKAVSFYFAPGSPRSAKKAILLEGENDVISVWEELQKLKKGYHKDFTPVGLGGKMDEDAFREPFLRQFDAVYELFDNDDAGNGYRQELNDKAPDVPVYHIALDPDFNDIDQLLKSVANAGQFKDMLDTANFVETKEFLIEREGFAHTWSLKNRKFRLEFAIDSYDQRSAQLEGTLLVHKQGALADKKIGGIDKIKVDSSIAYAKLALSQHLDAYYNDVKWKKEEPSRTFWELKDILYYSKEYHEIVRQLARYIFKSGKEEYEKKIAQIQKAFHQKSVAEVLREVNGYQNDAVDPNQLIVPIQLSQFFHVINNDGFFYFSKLVKEGETTKLVPCLISNKREEIRLDLLVKKDPQCLLLINNRYELRTEVPAAVMDPIEVSLQPYWVERWRNDQMDEADYDPEVLIKEIEGFIRQCYFASDEVVKVMALWIYATYFYTLFRAGFPYLIFNGPKGSGKSTFDSIIYLLALNPKFALDITEAALFRTINETGGTMILDEIEDLVDKKSVNNSGFAKVLKGGYADQGYVYRMNMDRGVSERFSVFGPKVISNITGIEDVIGDRCIFVRTQQAPEYELQKLTDPIIFKEERRSEVHSITSRCAISALTHFQRVAELFNSVDSRIHTGNARLTQILRPLLTMAMFVGGGYVEALMSYYEKEIKTVKDEIAANTLEGMLSNILKRAAEELAGIEKDKWVTDYGSHAYSTSLKYAAQIGLFEIDTMHLKVLCEEINTGPPIEVRQINTAMKHVLGPKFDMQKNRKQTTATLTDDTLIRIMNQKHPRIYRYYLNVEQFIDKTKLIAPLKAEGSLF